MEVYAASGKYSGLTCIYYVEYMHINKYYASDLYFSTLKIVLQIFILCVTT